MPGFLDGMFADSPDDPRYAANMALFDGMRRGDFTGGAMAYAQEMSLAKDRALRRRQLQQQIEAGDLAVAEGRRRADVSTRLTDAARQSYRTPEQANAQSMGPMPDGGTVPQVQPGFDAQGYTNRLYAIDPSTAVAFEHSIAKDNSPITVAPGASLLDRKTLKPVFTAPKDTAPTELAKLIAERDKYQPGTAAYQLYDMALRKQTTHQPGASVNVNTGKEGIANELKMRDDWRGEPVYKAHQEVQSAHSQITQALKQGSPAGDLAGATKLMKILDPGSVVRESELGMAMAASGLLDRVQNYGRMVMSGQKLTPTQRKDFQDLADKLASQSSNAYNAKRGEYVKFAGDWGLNGERIVGAASSVGTPAAEPAAPAAANIEDLLKKYAK